MTFWDVLLPQYVVSLRRIIQQRRLSEWMQPRPTYQLSKWNSSYKPSHMKRCIKFGILPHVQFCLKTYANIPTPRNSSCSFMNVTDHVIVKTCSLLEMTNSSVLDKVQRGEESSPETDIICDLFIGCSKPKIFLSGLDHGLTSHSENHTS